MRFRQTMAGVAVLALWAAVSPAAAAEVSLKERVEARLVKARLLDGASIVVEPGEGDTVVLSGTVATLAQARRAEREAGREAAGVDNRLRVDAPARSDADILKDVRSAVLGYVHYTVFDSVGVEVNDGRVALSGSVHMGYRRNDIEDRVAAVPGVRALESTIAVQRASSYDDRLRWQLLRRIYNGAVLDPYGANAPVRILVDGGHVTLTGVVNSRVDQFLVGMVARETLALSVDNQVQVASEKREVPKTGGATSSI